MDLTSELGQRYMRIIAMVALLLGLSDAALLLGITTGPADPMTVLGPTGFAYLSTFCVSRLFAAVGIWIGASWGAVLLVGATTIELILYLTGNPDIHVSPFDFIVRLVLIVAVLVLFGLRLRLRRTREQ